MSIGPTLETARLILRPPTQEDFDGFVEMGSEEETMRFIGGVKPADAIWRQVATLAGSWSLLGFSMFSVIEKETGQWIGRLGPWQPGGAQGNWPGTEVGWGLRASAMGKGLAQEGATAAIDWAFDTLGWDNVIHCIDKQNAPSIALALRLARRGSVKTHDCRRRSMIILWTFTANRALRGKRARANAQRVRCL